MKNLLIIIFFLLGLSQKVNSQTYSSLISDAEIQKILFCEIDNIKSNFRDKFSSHKIKSEIINWKKIAYNKETAFELLKNIIESDKQDTLKNVSDSFIDSDIEYLQQQFENQVGEKWEIKQTKIKFAKNPHKEFCSLSIPLFDKNHETAIIYKEEIYNSISACATLEVYIKYGNEWKYYKSIILWVV
ncbi:hypothetical protein [Flavobacterium sp.]|jgi:hypothetical protein|uniref:hypothetical protein n=1 Tax=Flavobacterium sp. TaxID=239 RepID=UPI0037BE9EF5